MSIKLSVIVTVFNEEENVVPLIQKIKTALKDVEYELIYVDDGSTDRTLKTLRKELYKRLVIVEFRRNYGQSAALMAGIDVAQGEFIATMDGDLQNDPDDLPKMLAMAEAEELDMVAGERANRQDGMFLRKIPSWIANYIIRTSSGVHLRDYGCAIRVMRAEVAKDLGLYGELHRFIPVLVSLETSRIQQIPVKHHARQFGESKYGLGRTFKVVSDLLLMLFFKRYLARPMHLFGNSGIIMFLVGVLINLYLLGLKVMGQDIWGKPLMILGLILLLGGIQFITIGIVVEIQVRTYYESQGKRPYSIRQIFRA
ncbi:MAG: glycosyltransferase family 2 protein [Lewinella sp.]|uniref:glycosyltransferase family 2 protein n=1 Tax=Lewinella TaxID=70994 RepID=UPI000379701A|nr:glycosyltransferase family 2 protein [Lewinella cohaerens]